MSHLLLIKEIYLVPSLIMFFFSFEKHLVCVVLDVEGESESRALVIEQLFLEDLNLEAEDNIGKETWN